MKIHDSQLVRIDKIFDLFKASEKDPLKNFMMQGYMDELEIIRATNLEKLFDACRYYDVRFIYVGKGELAACEDRLQHDSNWPQIWKISEILGMRSSCGNGNQYQNNDFKGRYFPSESYGGWDLLNNIKLSDEETEAKKFCRVVTRLEYRR